MNILIGAAGGGATGAVSSITKESLSWAAYEMRQAMIEDSKKFSGICVVGTEDCISNASGQSDGVNGGGLTGGFHGGVAGAATALMSIVVSPRSSRTLLGRLPSTTLDELSNAPGIDHAPNSNNRFTRNKHQRSLRADPATAKKT